MVDEGKDKTQSGPSAAAPSDKPNTDKTATAPGAKGAAPQKPVSPAARQPKPHSQGAALFTGALGGALIAALAAAAGVFLFPQKQSLSDADAARLATLETTASRIDTAIGNLDKRIGVVEGASSASGAKIEASNRTAQALAADVKALRDAIDAARAENPGGAAPAAPAAPAEPKPEPAPAPEKPAAAENPAAVAIIIAALREKLASGASFGTELAALGTLGVDPALLAPLKTVVNGAPTDRSLSAAFQALEPKLLADVAPPEADSVAGRFVTHLKKLVQIRHVGEIPGDSPEALASQVIANVQRGDLDAAFAALSKLPEPARKDAAAWFVQAQNKQAAVAAAQAIREAALAKLAQTAAP